jgi:hypothetical protein
MTNKRQNSTKQTDAFAMKMQHTISFNIFHNASGKTIRVLNSVRSSQEIETENGVRVASMYKVPIYRYLLRTTRENQKHCRCMWMLGDIQGTTRLEMCKLIVDFLKLQHGKIE